MMENERINFNLVQIKELAFSYSGLIDPKVTEKLEKLEVGINVNYRWNLEKNIFGVQLDIAYVDSKSNPQTNEILKFSNYTEFIVENLNKILKGNGPEDFEIDENLETTFVSIATSTARGMIASRTNGTFLGRFIFPLINPRELILTKKIKEGKQPSIKNQEKEPKIKKSLQGRKGTK